MACRSWRRRQQRAAPGDGGAVGAGCGKARVIPSGSGSSPTQDEQSARKCKALSKVVRAASVRKAKEEKEARRKEEEERRLAIEEKRREKWEAKALLAKQEAERQAEEQRRHQERLEEIQQRRLNAERQGEAEWKAKEEQRKSMDAQFGGAEGFL
eukprot:Skav216872  [mRNA]  locus=scaffold1042:355900:362805:- [translate_table: standard]